MTDLTPWQRLRIEQIKLINNLPRSPIVHPQYILIAAVLAVIITFCTHTPSRPKPCPDARGLGYDPALVEMICK